MAKDEEVIRKLDPTAKRKNIHVTTLNKIKLFLEDQECAAFRSEITKHTGVDFNSLNLALTMITHRVDNEGKISVKKRRKKND